MAYLNILIGFTFIMLVFAIGVSIVQAALARLLFLKGKAIAEHLLEKLRELWDQADLPAQAYDRVAAALTTHLTTRHGKHARTLHASSIGNRQVVAEILRRFGKEELPDLVGRAHGDAALAATWERLVQEIEHDWDSIASMVSASYTGNTRRYLLGLSIAAVLLFNVDAIRIVRVLAVDPDVRDALVTDAARAGAPEPTNTLTDWQQQNLAELRSTGLPLGWELAPLWVCDGGTTATSQEPCSGAVSPWDTVLLWLVALLGLLLGIGLVSQGAPFWFKLLQTELGLRGVATTTTTTTTATTATTATTTTTASTTTGSSTAGAPPPSPTEPAPSPAPVPVTDPSTTRPVLIVDTYSGNGIPHWAELMASSTFSGAILKATDGVSFSPAKAWFVPQWQAARSAAGARYRQTFFLGAYHWLELYDNPEQQADYYCSIIEQAGWGAGDMLPIVDVEFGSSGPRPAPNYKALVDRNAQLVIDSTSRYAARLKQNLGSDTQVVLYASQVLKELQISDHMGCDYLWTAEYGVSKPDLSAFYHLGWTDQQIAMWQYTDGSPGSNKTRSPQLPDEVPGMGPRDCSVFRDGDLALFRSMLIKR